MWETEEADSLLTESVWWGAIWKCISTHVTAMSHGLTAHRDRRLKRGPAAAHRAEELYLNII